LRPQRTRFGHVSNPAGGGALHYRHRRRPPSTLLAPGAELVIVRWMPPSAFVSLLWLPVAGCWLAPDHDPQPAVVPPPAYSEESSGAPLPERWWSDFGDEELSRLVEAALDGNFQLKGAWARLQQADAIARAAFGGMLP